MTIAYAILILGLLFLGTFHAGRMVLLTVGMVGILLVGSYVGFAQYISVTSLAADDAAYKAVNGEECLSIRKNKHGVDRTWELYQKNCMTYDKWKNYLSIHGNPLKTN